MMRANRRQITRTKRIQSIRSMINQNLFLVPEWSNIDLCDLARCGRVVYDNTVKETTHIRLAGSPR